MYRIGSDKRSFKSCMMVYRALVLLIKDKHMSIESISVSDLSRESTISRGTFYRHFDQVIDVLVWACDVEIDKASEKFLLANDLTFFNLYFFSYWCSHPELLEIVFATGRSDLFLTALETSILNETVDVLFKSSKLDIKRRRFLVSIWAAIQWMILKQWIQYGKTETPKELTKIALHNLPMPQ